METQGSGQLGEASYLCLRLSNAGSVPLEDVERELRHVARRDSEYDKLTWPTVMDVTPDVRRARPRSVRHGPLRRRPRPPAVWSVRPGSPGGWRATLGSSYETADWFHVRDVL